MIKMIKGIFWKYKEVILYFFFGGLSMIISIGSFSAFNYGFGMNALTANILSWIITIIFVYITNKKWVFEIKSSNEKEILTEFILFVTGRVSTLVLEEAILFIGIYLFDINSIFVKIGAQIVVIVSNYIISKFIVFKNKK